MKKIFALLVFIALASAVNAAAIKVVVNDVTPQPVQPGSDLTLRVTFTNVDSDFAHPSASVDLRPPFSLKTSTEDFENGFDICSFCSRTNTYFITVDSQASSGTYPVFIRTNGGEVRTINVTVRGVPNIVISSAIITNVTQGRLFELPISVSNIGTGAANQIKVSSKSSDFISLGGSVSTVKAVPAGNSTAVKFFMIASTNIETGSYALPFELSYVDESGASYNTTQNAGVQVVNEGKLIIENIKVSSATGGEAVAGQPASVIVRLQNVGYGKADAIESELSCGDQSSRAFLGQLKSEEDAPAVFAVTLPQSTACTMTTRYADDLGQHATTNAIDVRVKGADFPFIIVIIIIAAGAFVWYRRRRK